MKVSVFTDGGALNNPGEGAIGVVIYRNGKKIYTLSQSIGVTTNNRAEYTAVFLALKALKSLLQTGKLNKNDDVSFYSDSRLVVNQLRGNFRIKSVEIRKYVNLIKKFEQELPFKIEYINVPREKNKVADSLVKKAFKT